MATDRKTDARRPAHRRRRRPTGVPVLLTILLLILALLMGGLGGFVLARRTDTHVHELQALRDRVTELENTLTLIGHPIGDEADPGQWPDESAGGDSALDALSGSDWGDEEDSLWEDDSLLSATLPETGEAVVVAEFDGGTLLSTEVVPAYNDRLTSLIFDGEDADAVAEETLNEVMAELVTQKLVAAKAKEMGLTTLTDEDLRQVEAEAAERYETQLRDYVAFSMDGEGDREEAARRLEEESGVTQASIAESLKKDWWIRKYRAAVVADVSVDEDTVRARYDALLADQRERFAADPEAFESAHLSGAVIVYRPEGYRAVRDVLIAFPDESAAEAARLSEQIRQGAADEDAQSRLDALYAPLEATADEVEQKLTSGTPFAELMAEYGCSPALNTEALRAEGFYIRSGSYVNSDEFVEGALMLESPGQVTSQLHSPYGVHLVEYIGDLTPGDVPFGQVKEAVRADVLREEQDAYYARECEKLLEGANVKYYPERLH